MTCTFTDILPHHGKNRCTNLVVPGTNLCKDHSLVSHTLDQVARVRGVPEPVDMINHPPHYADGPPCQGCGRPIECIDVVEHMDFRIGNVVKYLWRAGKKGAELEDIKKAYWYLGRTIQQMEKKK